MTLSSVEIDDIPIVTFTPCVLSSEQMGTKKLAS